MNGDLEPFSDAKIRATATRVGVPAALQNELLAYLASHLYNEIPTSEILTLVRGFLKKSSSPHLGDKFNLKKALMELGPSGYPFEKYLSYVLESQNYHVVTNRVLQGRCVSHEVDLLATDKTSTYVVEAKYHNRAQYRTDVKVALYIKARYDDLSSGWRGEGSLHPWLITNTRFTSDALTYGLCVGLKMTSWDYPSGKSLREIIEKAQLHPITLIDSVPPHQMEALLNYGYVLCRHVLEKKDEVQKLLPRETFNATYEEAQAICGV